MKHIYLWGKHVYFIIFYPLTHFKHILMYFIFICVKHTCTHIHTHTRGPLRVCSGLPGWAGTRKVKPGISVFSGARDSERQWHQLGHMHICTLTQTHNHASIPPLSFLQAGCPSCRPTNSIKALKALYEKYAYFNLFYFSFKRKVTMGVWNWLCHYNSTPAALDCMPSVLWHGWASGRASGL